MPVCSKLCHNDPRVALPPSKALCVYQLKPVSYAPDCFDTSAPNDPPHDLEHWKVKGASYCILYCVTSVPTKIHNFQSVLLVFDLHTCTTHLRRVH